MGLLDIFRRNTKMEAPKAEERSVSIGGLSFNSISSYSYEKAMSLGAVYCAVNQISNSLAMMPIYIYRVDDNGKTQVKHSLYNVLNMSPDNKYSHFQWMKQMVSSMYLRGNAYAYIQRDEQLNVVSLTYIDSDYVTPMLQPNGTVKYIVAGMSQAIDAVNMIHLYLYLDNTFRGISTIQYASKALETATEAENHASNFFKSGANLSGVIKASTTLTNDQKKQIQESWRNAFQTGASNKVSVAVLPQGLDYQPISISPEDAELLDTRKYDVINIARFFNISPIKLFDLSDVSYNSMEAAQISYVNDTVLPVAKLILSEFNRKLFKPSQTGKLMCDFDFTELLTANKESEANYYKSMLVNGVMTLNEVRARLGLEPVDEMVGDKHWIQISYATMEDVAQGKYIKGQDQGQKQDETDNKVKGE